MQTHTSLRVLVFLWQVNIVKRQHSFLQVFLIHEAIDEIVTCHIGWVVVGEVRTDDGAIGLSCAQYTLITLWK